MYRCTLLNCKWGATVRLNGQQGRVWGDIGYCGRDEGGGFFMRNWAGLAAIRYMPDLNEANDWVEEFRKREWGRRRELKGE